MTTTTTATTTAMAPQQLSRRGTASTASNHAEDIDSKSFVSSVAPNSGAGAFSHAALLGAPSHHHRPDASTTTLAHSLNPIMLGYDAHNADMRTLAVDGADDNQAITFSAAGHEKKVVWRLNPPRAPDTSEFPIEVQGLVDDTELHDVISGQHFYTVRSDRDCKNFTVIPQFGVETNIIMKPTKSFATYKCECEGPAGKTWIWKGNIFKNMELYEKNKRGEKKIVAIYVRTSTRSHQLRVYSDLVPTDQPIYSSPTLALAIASLYPFLAMYRQALERDFTSDRRVLEKAAGAQPSGWDARFMGSDPAQKKNKNKSNSPTPPSSRSPHSHAQHANSGDATPPAAGSATPIGNGEGGAQQQNNEPRPQSTKMASLKKWRPW